MMKHKINYYGCLNVSNAPQIRLLTAKEILLISRNTKITEEVREENVLQDKNMFDGLLCRHIEQLHDSVQVNVTSCIKVISNEVMLSRGNLASK